VLIAMYVIIDNGDVKQECVKVEDDYTVMVDAHNVMVDTHNVMIDVHNVMVDVCRSFLMFVI